LGLVAVDAQAQALRGRVVTASDARPIPGALVELQDSVGRPMQRVLSTASGAFRLLPGRQGAFRVRVAAIGYSVHPVALVTMTGGDAQLEDFRMEATIAILPDLVAAGKRRLCGREILDDPLLGRLLEGARASLTLMEQSLGLGTRYTIEEIRTQTLTKFEPPQVTRDTTRGVLNQWPLESVNPLVLRDGGFGRLLEPQEGEGRVYYGPDLRVLFADWFLEGHCFGFDTKARDTEAGMIRVRYEPRRTTRLVDIAGELLIDATTLSLRELTFEHRHLPSHIPFGAAGGLVGFAQLEAGGWLPVRWAIYGPIESVSPPIRSGQGGSAARPASTVSRPVILGGVTLVGRVVGDLR
jgi:hypothetical protein